MTSRRPNTNSSTHTEKQLRSQERPCEPPNLVPVEAGPAQNVSVAWRGADRDRLQDRRLLAECAVGSVGVVMGNVLVQHALEMPLRDDQDSVETFAPGTADPALGVRFRL